MEYFLNLLVFYTIAFILVSSTLGLKSKTNTLNQANFKLQEKFYNTVQVQDDLQWEGWVKFFNYEQSDQVFRPQKFYINNQFYNQKVLNSERLSKKDGLYVSIPDRFHFYAKLSSKALNIYTERDLHYRKIVDTLDVKLIRPLNINDLLTSSIKNLGSFAEGHCVSVETYYPKAYEENFLPEKENKNSIPNFWIICLDSEDIKQKLIERLMAVKVQYQKKLEEENKIKEEEKEEMAPEESGRFERYKGPGANELLDGYLVKINDWTKCTLKCGGGLSYQQWRCIPPRPGGKPCTGELVRKRPCNVKPCPGVSFANTQDMLKSQQEKDKLIVESEVIKNPVMKSQYFTSHPQQYIPCQIKENDVLYRKQVEDKTLVLPSRIIMNTNTLILYPNADYKNPEYTFKLKKTSMYKSKSDNCCVVLKSEASKFEFCALGEDCGSAKNPVFFRQWYNAFRLFQGKCYNKLREETTTGLNVTETESRTLGANIRMDMDFNEAKAKEQVLNSKIAERTQSLRNERVLDSQSLEMKALDREVEIEEKIKKEEYLKAKERTKLLLDQMNKEKAKKDKLEKAIEERENEEIKIRDSNRLSQTVNEIKKDTKSEVLSKREKLKKKIKEIRLRANRRQAMIEQQINLIRGKMTTTLIEANKSGDKAKCKTARKSQSSIDSYCDENLVEDLNANIECKKELNFCFVCCDNEYGKLNFDERDSCYKFCGDSDISGVWTDRLV